MNNQAGLRTQRMLLKVLSPTYIGGNSENNLKKYQYIYNPGKNQVITIDEHKMMIFLHQRKLMASYEKFVEFNSSKRNPEALNNWFKKEKLTGADVKSVAGAVLDTKNLNTEKMNDINRFIKDIYQNPYIPGSSLKGAIRTALVSHFILNHAELFKAQRSQINKLLTSGEKANYKKRELKKISDRMESDLFTIDKKNNIKSLAGLSVSDSEAFAKKELCLVKKEDYTFGNDSPHYLPIYRECLKPGSQTKVSLTFDRYKSVPKFGLEEPVDILEVLDTFKQLLIGERGILRVFEDLDTYLPQCDDTAGLLFLGGGAGYQAKTFIAALFPDEEERLYLMQELMEVLFPRKRHLDDNGISPRTLKLADYGQQTLMMGLCELTEEIEC